MTRTGRCRRGGDAKPDPALALLDVSAGDVAGENAPWSAFPRGP